MNFVQRFTFLFSAPTFEAEDLEGLRVAEIIAAIQSVPACQINGSGQPMFHPTDGSCVRDSLSCIMARPATDNDVTLCNELVSKANPGDAADVTVKRNLTVATFLSAAHTCE